jgi:hypothetical protein
MAHCGGMKRFTLRAVVAGLLHDECALYVAE